VLRPWSNAILAAAATWHTGITAAVRLGRGLVIAVPVSRQRVIDRLRQMGLSQAADEALRTLPDPVDEDRITEFCEKSGISREQVVNWMGGSP
jgi:hypothetical protein